jgi:hypothetical protein
MRTLALVIVGLLIAAAIAWDASERHYDACVNAAKARGSPLGSGPDSSLDRTLAHDARPSIDSLIKGCSRLPW